MKGRININRPTTGIQRVVLPRVGFIKVGYKEKATNGKEYPKSVDYFIASGRYAGLFTKAYGEKPQTIQIIFPDDCPEKVCNEMYEYRDDDGRRIAYGDGETFFVWNGKQYCQYSTKDYPDLMAGVAGKPQPCRIKRRRRLDCYVDRNVYYSFGSWGCRGLAVRNKGYGVNNSKYPRHVRRHVAGTGIC